MKCASSFQNSDLRSKKISRLQLSDLERLILANQYEILAHLKPDQGYEDVARELRDGHKWLYRQYLDNLISPELPDESAEFVATILGIYRDLASSYRGLGDKSGIEERLVQFPGFDGNNESDLLHFTSALRKADRFTETIGDSARNSHMPMKDVYRRMIEEWERLGRPQYPYSEQTIQKILDARIHPESRK